MIKIDIYDLLCLCDKLSHRVDEQNETIEELQTELKYRKNENIRLAEKNNNLQRNIGYLCEENTRLRHVLNEVKNNANNKIY